MTSLSRLIRYSAAATLLFGVLSGCGSFVFAQDGLGNAAGEVEVIDPRKVVALVQDAESIETMRAAAIAAGYRELETEDLGGLGLIMISFEMPDGVTGPEAIAFLEGEVPGSVVGINHAYRPQQTTKAMTSHNFAGEMMGWPEGGCRAQTAVGLIDSGVDWETPALLDVRAIAESFADGSAAQMQHGTEVATVLLATTGLQGATIYDANVFRTDAGLGQVAGAEALVSALGWLAEEDVKYVNLALAGPYNKLLDLAVTQAAARGMIMVAAVGNEGPNVEPLYPAAFDGVIAVTAVDVDGRIYRNAVRGPHVDVAAPGVDILVDTGASTRFVTGTSIATPLVTARLVADPTLAEIASVTELRAKLEETSSDLGPAGHDPIFGFGLMRAEGACGGAG